MSGRAFRAVLPAILLVSLCLDSPAGADPRWWWDDAQVSTGGPVSDLDLDVLWRLDSSKPAPIYVVWIEWPDPVEGSLMLTASYNGGLSFCTPLWLGSVRDPAAEVAVAVTALINGLDDLMHEVQVLHVRDGRLQALDGSVDGFSWVMVGGECTRLGRFVEDLKITDLPESGVDALDLAGGPYFYGVWRHTTAGGDQEIRYARGTLRVPFVAYSEVVWESRGKLPVGGSVSRTVGRPSVWSDGWWDVNVAFPDRGQGSILYLRSTDRGVSFSATGVPPPSPPAVVNTPVPGRLAGPVALDGSPDWHGVFWYQDLGFPVELQFDAQFFRDPQTPDPAWGPDLGVGAGGVGRDEGVALSVFSGGGPGDPAPVFLFWTDLVGTATEILSRGGLLEADAPVPIDLDTYPFPPDRPSDPSVSTILAITACTYDEVTGGCASSRVSGSARYAVSGDEEGDAYVAWIDDRTGTPSVWFKRTDRVVDPPEPDLQLFCPAPDAPALNVSFRQLESFRYVPGARTYIPEKMARYLVYYGRDPGGPYENTDRDGSDPGVPDTIFLTADANLPDPAWADITGLETGTTYYVIVVPEDEARNRYPPGFDPLADRPDSPDNEVSFTIPTRCDKECGPFVFGGPVTAEPGDCELLLSWHEARGDPPLLYDVYDVFGGMVPVATGLATTSWVYRPVPWHSRSITYQVQARDGCVNPGPRTGESDESDPARAGDFTLPEVGLPVLSQSGPCWVRVDAVITDSCSSAGAQIIRDGAPRCRWAVLPHDDPVPADGLYTYQVLAVDSGGNQALSTPAQITVSGCTESPRCLYRAHSWDFHPAELFLDTRPVLDIAFAPPYDVPYGPCPFPSGELVPESFPPPRWNFILGRNLIFYQVDGADMRDMKVVADPDAFSDAVRIVF